MRKLLKFQDSFSERTRFFIISGVSGLSVAISFSMEFIFEQIPCLLCLVQRGLHGLLLGIALMGVFSNVKSLSRKCCQGILIAGCLVAGYHTLVQFKLVKDRCKTHFLVDDLLSYKTLLMNNEKKRPSCSEGVWKIGPIPISVMNGILSILLLSLLTKKREAKVAAEAS